MATEKVSIKLLIDTKRSKVLFAEAGKDFVDFLLFLMGLPLGTVTRLLTKNLMVGSIGNIYASIERIDKTFLQSSQTKEALLSPMPALKSQGLLLLGGSYDGTTNKKFYQCLRRTHSYVSDDCRAVCPSCKSWMIRETTYVPYVGPKVEVSTTNGEGGFVKGAVTYMVMDDLVVEPISAISIIVLLNKFGVKEIGYLKEQVVHLDMAQGLKLLKSSLTTKNVLTTVFLGRG